MVHIKYGRCEKLIVVFHVLNSKNSLDKSFLKHVRHVKERRFLEAYESPEIILMNNDDVQFPSVVHTVNLNNQFTYYLIIFQGFVMK